MPIKLPDIDPNRIGNIVAARHAISTLLNLVEELVGRINQMSKENQELKGEIAKLKGQPLPPQFTRKENRNYSVSRLFQKKVKLPWHKSAKKGRISIDREVYLPEADTCTCGSKSFLTIRTHEKIVQGIIIRRNNTRYHGRDKQCVYHSALILQFLVYTFIASKMGI